MLHDRRHILGSALGLAAIVGLEGCSRPESLSKTALELAVGALFALSRPEAPSVKLGAAFAFDRTFLITTASLSIGDKILAEDSFGRKQPLLVTGHDPETGLRRLGADLLDPRIKPLSLADRPERFSKVAGLGVSPELWPILAEGRIVHPHFHATPTQPDLMVWSGRLTLESAGGPLISPKGQLVGIHLWPGTLASLQSSQGLILPCDQITPALARLTARK